jgi:hypothetical protein
MPATLRFHALEEVASDLHNETKENFLLNTLHLFDSDMWADAPLSCPVHP